jgi:hypothetical protein
MAYAGLMGALSGFMHFLGNGAIVQAGFKNAAGRCRWEMSATLRIRQMRLKSLAS